MKPGINSGLRRRWYLENLCVFVDLTSIFIECHCISPHKFHISFVIRPRLIYSLLHVPLTISHSSPNGFNLDLIQTDYTLNVFVIFRILFLTRGIHENLAVHPLCPRFLDLLNLFQKFLLCLLCSLFWRDRWWCRDAFLLWRSLS